MATYRCPQCRIVADINLTKRVKSIHVPYDRERPGFPRHGDCELARSLDEIDLGKLEKVE